MMTVLPNGIVLAAAIVCEGVGFCPFAVTPLALGPQQILQAQYAVTVAVMMLVRGICVSYLIALSEAIVECVSLRVQERVPFYVE